MINNIKLTKHLVFSNMTFSFKYMSYSSWYDRCRKKLTHSSGTCACTCARVYEVTAFVIKFVLFIVNAMDDFVNNNTLR